MGMAPREWYENLNRRVFFWVRPERLLKLLGARAYRDRPAPGSRAGHGGVAAAARGGGFDLPDQLRRHLRVGPCAAGSGTFRRVVDHPRSKRPVVELAVDYAVPDARDLVLAVSRWHGGDVLEEVWSRAGAARDRGLRSAGGARLGLVFSGRGHERMAR